jgi:hypothetical protein
MKSLLTKNQNTPIGTIWRQFWETQNSDRYRKPVFFLGYFLFPSLVHSLTHVLGRAKLFQLLPQLKELLLKLFQGSMDVLRSELLKIWASIQVRTHRLALILFPISFYLFFIDQT